MVAFASFRFVPNNGFMHRSKQHRHSIHLFGADDLL